MDQPGRPRITDSGWFWATVFSAMSLAGIGLIAGKFEVRQRQVEAEDREVVAPTRIVPLWTLATAAALATALSATMLARDLRRPVADGGGP
jgi:hypothetical protein